MAAQEKLKQLIDDAFEKVNQAHQQEIDVLHAKIEELQAKVKIQTEAETDTRIREIIAHEQVSVEAWIKDAIEQVIVYGDSPMIRVESYCYERLKAHAAAKGFTIEALTTSREVAQQLIALIDNFLI